MKKKLLKIMRENISLQNLSVDDYMKNNCGEGRYLWDFLMKIEIRSDQEWNFYEENELKKLYLEKRLNQVRIDIKEINNISNSKSLLNEFKTLDDVVIENSKEYIKEVTIENIQKLKKHRESKIFHQKDETIFFTPYNNRLTWSNTGGSHHFMAIRYLSNKLNHKELVSGNLVIKGLNSKKIKDLLKKYSIYLFNDNEKLRCKIKKLKINYISSSDKLNKRRLLFIFPENKEHKKIITLLNKNNCLNLESYFMKYIKDQQKNLIELFYKVSKWRKRNKI